MILSVSELLFAYGVFVSFHARLYSPQISKALVTRGKLLTVLLNIIEYVLKSYG